MTKGEALEPFSTSINAGLEMNMNHNTSIMLEYAGAFRKEYQDHSGMLRLKFKF